LFISANQPWQPTRKPVMMRGVNTRWTSYAAWKGETAGCLTGEISAGGGELLLAGTATGILVSSDGGRSWSSLSPENPVAMVEAIALAADRVVFAGGATGLFRSEDTGTTWRRLVGAHVHAVVAFAGRTGEVCLVAGTDRDGVIRSGDGGRTWDSANPGLLESTVLALAETPVVAGARTIFAGTTSGIYVSRNDGKAWRPAEIPGDECAVQCLAVSPTWVIDRHAFAGTEESGLLRSRDGGLRWDSVPFFGSRGVSAVACAGGDQHGLLVAVASGRQVMLSEDGGQTWDGIAETPGEIASLRFVGDSARLSLVVGQFDEGVCLLVHDHVKRASAKGIGS
jgi:photosystem II stability/assembly factor-like uncharacterized protein